MESWEKRQWTSGTNLMFADHSHIYTLTQVNCYDASCCEGDYMMPSPESWMAPAYAEACKSGASASAEAASQSGGYITGPQ